MLINISNHPSSKWSNEQIQAAYKIAKDNVIVDIPFPNVNPHEGGMYIEELIGIMLDTIDSAIDKHTPTMIKYHIMGEMGLTYRLVNTLGSNVCYHSTTERVTVEKPDGTKESIFKFVQFRKY